ncbi:ATP-binding protein [Streptomyces sp. F001]|uniref:ATP-binding protein n=1 Tax=Streptomyces sp. F001 TaxID=1510026 RepID=UPI00101E5B18|nr:ATP-binding protein [Streptomyces sp. F001]RZB16415.1 ATP-binding protein [Streptomyces sp. F001]
MPLPRQRRFPRSRASVRDAREFTLQVLTEWGCTDRLDDIRLCVSELVTNALLHGVPPGREYCVSLARDGAVIRLEVRDSGDRDLPSQQPHSEIPDTGEESGRGLFLARELADDLGISKHVVGKTVWVTFKAALQHEPFPEAET